MGDPELRRNRAGTDECRIKLASRDMPEAADRNRVWSTSMSPRSVRSRVRVRGVFLKGAGDLSDRLENDGGSHVLIDQLDVL
jgi:hypothetical protein